MTTSSGSITQFQYATTDPDEGHAFLRSVYPGTAVSVHGRDDNFRFASTVLQVGRTTLSRLEHSMAVTMSPRDGLDQASVLTTRRPTTDLDVNQRRYRLGAGGSEDAVLMKPRVPYSGTWDTLDVEVAALDPDTIADVAAELTGSTRAVEFDFDAAVSAVAAAQWRRTYTLVRRVATANANKPHSAVLTDSLSRLLATTALTCFPNTTMRDHDTSPARSSPESLRRAVAHIEANLDQPLRLAAISEAARVSPRALNQTFNRHLGISPINYAHRTRLDRAHHDLKAAEPGDGQTVTAIAARWGFSDLPRFGVYYRRAYGQPPSRTLRQEPA